jgi:hypothetical protein
MRAIYARILLAAFVFVTATAIAAGVSPQSYHLPDHGELTMLVPDGRTSDLQQPPNRLPPTIVLKPRSGAPFVGHPRWK